MGRPKKPAKSDKSVQYQNRTMDIDLLFYDNLQIDTPELTIPHPKMGERKFVLIPLNDIAPDKVHPVSGMKVQELLQICPDNLEVKSID